MFDVGETLVDESRAWAGWAEWLGVSPLTLFGVLGGVVERGEHHRRAFELIRPGFDYPREVAARRAAGHRLAIEPVDLYPDARPCLAALRTEGYLLALVGNQPVEAEAALRSMGLGVDVVASSTGWGAEKPDPAFFARVAATLGLPPAAIAHVGDRVDNDVAPSAAAGMVSVFLRRGPWGYLQAGSPEAARAHIRLDGLAGLPSALRGLDAGATTPDAAVRVPP